MKPRSELLIDALSKRILVLDGAMGTTIQDEQLTARDFGGEALEGCNENLVLTRPDIIEKIHENFLKAGADILETNTFGGTPLVLAEYDLSAKADAINLEAAKIARRAADKYSTASQPRFVAGSIGPTTKAITVTGGVTFEELRRNFFAQAKALYEGDVDYFLVETCQDTRNIKAALLAIQDLWATGLKPIPVAVSGTIEPMGTMLAGQTVEALYASLAQHELLYIGLNCATGPEFMTDPIRSLSELSRFRVSCVPNAGLPDEDGQYLETPQMVAKVLKRFLENKWVNVIGGCCGTRPAHIQAMAEAAKGMAPRTPSTRRGSYLSGIEFLEITDDLRPVLVGERTNVIGSKKFKDLICEEKFEEASEVARSQVKKGAQIVDVCLANPDRDELSDVQKFLEIAIKKIKAPIMIDSTDAKVIESALTYCQGKAIINSINLEDGEERFEEVVPMARRFGAAFVVGTIDDDPEQGMGVTRERKLAIAKRSYDLLTQKYGVEPEDITFDPLVFPCATGDAQYVGSAVETIEGVRLIKQNFPRCKTVLGISNVSFGLPPAGREVLNSVFLYHCVQAGLDMAIVNSEKLERYTQIPEEERKLADDLLYNRITPEHPDPVAAFTEYFRKRGKTSKKAVEKSTLTLEERLAQYIIEGSKEGLAEDLAEARKKYKPLEIINGPLMKGMDVVGKLFNENKLIVAEVLQSAEAMKAAVSNLEPFMEKNVSSSRGKMVLATVKGDVHDIGKNLVEIILSNNGFEIVNLGIKVPPEKLIEAVREHQPDVVGLSGLLVKSAQQMVITAEDFSRAGVDVPILVGGAALTENFVDQKIAKVYTGTVMYAKDAMKGLDLAKTIVDPEAFPKFKEELKEKRKTRAAAREAVKAPTQEAPIQVQRSKEVQILSETPTPPDFDRHVIRNTPLPHIWSFINPLMLYGRHLGIKGSLVRKLEAQRTDAAARAEIEKENPKALEIWNAVEAVKAEYQDTAIFRPSAVYRYYRAQAQGSELRILDESGTGKVLAKLTFPRQARVDGLCLSDYVLEKGEDSIAFFVTTVGRGVRELAENLKNRGEYVKSHVIQALAIETAEAYAEYLHSKIRGSWGFSDPIEMTMMDRFQGKYRGKRYSFGYPACPRLDDQRILFDLLKPEEIGVQLTEGFMMDPEASVSAIVFHHPDASYFSVGGDPENRS